MEEVEILCDRVIILDKGKIIAQGTCEELKKLANIEEKITIENINLSEKYLTDISSLKNVDVVNYANNTLYITYNKGKNNLIDLIEFLKDKRLKYSSIYMDAPTLNDVFLELTGKDLRD